MQVSSKCPCLTFGEVWLDLISKVNAPSSNQSLIHSVSFRAVHTITNTFTQKKTLHLWLLGKNIKGATRLLKTQVWWHREQRGGKVRGEMIWCTAATTSLAISMVNTCWHTWSFMNHDCSYYICRYMHVFLKSWAYMGLNASCAKMQQKQQQKWALRSVAFFWITMICWENRILHARAALSNLWRADWAQSSL